MLRPSPTWPWPRGLAVYVACKGSSGTKLHALAASQSDSSPLNAPATATSEKGLQSTQAGAGGTGL